MMGWWYGSNGWTGSASLMGGFFGFVMWTLMIALLVAAIRWLWKQGDK